MKICQKSVLGRGLAALIGEMDRVPDEDARRLLPIWIVRFLSSSSREILAIRAAYLRKAILKI